MGQTTQAPKWLPNQPMSDSCSKLNDESDEAKRRIPKAAEVPCCKNSIEVVWIAFGPVMDVGTAIIRNNFEPHRRDTSHGYMRTRIIKVLYVVFTKCLYGTNWKRHGTPLWEHTINRRCSSNTTRSIRKTEQPILSVIFKTTFFDNPLILELYSYERVE